MKRWGFVESHPQKPVPLRWKTTATGTTAKQPELLTQLPLLRLNFSAREMEKNVCYWLRHLQEPFGSFVILSFGAASPWGGENETATELCVCVCVWLVMVGNWQMDFSALLRSHVVRLPRWCKLAQICLSTRSMHEAGRRWVLSLCFSGLMSWYHTLFCRFKSFTLKRFITCNFLFQALSLH